MVVVDSAVFVDYFRRGDKQLSALLDNEEVLLHPFVHGELLLGNLGSRREIILEQLREIVPMPIVRPEDVAVLIASQRLFGTGLGWTDVNLLASARMFHVPLWTRDRALDRAAHRLGVAARF